MWAIFNSKVDKKILNRVKQQSLSIQSAKEERHFISSGKEFFNNQANLNLLSAIHNDIWQDIAINRFYKQPVIDHAYLLYKNAGGPATEFHQDISYWTNRGQQSYDMLTIWLAIEDITPNSGCLLLDLHNKSSVTEMQLSNHNHCILAHEKHNYNMEHDGQTLSDSQKTKFQKELSPISLLAGQIILFDAFEVHGSTANTSNKTRLALKIVYKEKSTNDMSLIDLKELTEIIA